MRRYALPILLVPALLVVPPLPTSTAGDASDAPILGSFCVGSAKELRLDFEPTFSHAKGATGSGDGVSLWRRPTPEAAFWDYQETSDGLYVYLLTGYTSQTSCSILACLEDMTAIQWAERVQRAVDGGDLETISADDACPVDVIPPE